MQSEEDLRARDEDIPERVHLGRIARELVTIRKQVTEIIGYVREAEADMPERYRRFVNAFHDVHDIKYMYEEHGQDAPPEILREIERMHDRYRQILDIYNAEGGAFNKIRRAMAGDPRNRYDHERYLAAPRQETTDETRTSRGDNGGAQTRTDSDLD